MKVSSTDLPEVLIIEPKNYQDARGNFFEVWVGPKYQALGIGGKFVQDNFSRSVFGTLRGLHYQEPKGQGKLITILYGRIFDVIVDVRKDSPRFGTWVGIELDGQELKQIWIPPGFAHGFCVLSEIAYFHYKCTEEYVPEAERLIRWDDPELSIDWPIKSPVLSGRDASAPMLLDAAILPQMGRHR